MSISISGSIGVICLFIMVVAMIFSYLTKRAYNFVIWIAWAIISLILIALVHA